MRRLRECRYFYICKGNDSFFDFEVLFQRRWGLFLFELKLQLVKFAIFIFDCTIIKIWLVQSRHINKVILANSICSSWVIGFMRIFTVACLGMPIWFAFFACPKILNASWLLSYLFDTLWFLPFCIRIFTDLLFDINSVSLLSNLRIKGSLILDSLQ